MEIVCLGTFESLPSRGGWIEIRSCAYTARYVNSPSPHGEGGLKFNIKSIDGDEAEVPPLTGRVD